MAGRHAGTSLKKVTKASASKRAAKQESARALRARQKAFEPLVIELYSVVCRGLTFTGFPIKQQKALLRQALRETPVPSHSGSLLEQFQRLGDLLTTWLEELPYIDEQGRPRVLPIRGRGATFESLARQFMPEKPLAEVIDLACRNASVGTLSGGRIAVHGDPMVDLAKSPEAALAQAIAHVTRIINTCRHNVEQKRLALGAGRFERMVAQLVTREQFEIFEKAIRPLLDNLCQQVNKILKQTPTKHKRGQFAGGLGIYLYFDDATQSVRTMASGTPRPRISRHRS